MFTLARVCAFAIVLSGCAGPYQHPIEGPRATIETKWTRAELVFGGQQAFTLLGDQVCGSRLGNIGSFGWNSAEPKQYVVRAGSPIFLRASTGGVGAEGTISCMNVISFVPESGATYELTHELSKGKCQAVVKDRKSGTSPAALQSHPVDRSCRLY